MANELLHDVAIRATATELTQAEYDSIVNHKFESQAVGDMLYASTTTQLRRLAIGSANDVLAVSGGIPAWTSTPSLAGLTMTGNIALGANKLTTTNGLIKETAADSLGIRNAADDAAFSLTLLNVHMTGDLNMNASGEFIRAPNSDAAFIGFQARDTGVGLVEIARLVGAADPEFQLGLNGNALRSSYAGLLGFFATAPQAKPTGVAITAAGIHAALVTLGLIAA